MSLRDLAGDDGRVSLRDLLRGIREHHPQMTFMQTNLISDGSVPAQHVDANLVNPWGVSYGPTGPFWVSDNGTGLATV